MAVMHKPQPLVCWQTPCLTLFGGVYAKWSIYLFILSSEKGTPQGLVILGVIAILRFSDRLMATFLDCVIQHQVGTYVDSLKSSYHHLEALTKIFLAQEDDSYLPVPIDCPDLVEFVREYGLRQPAKCPNNPDCSDIAVPDTETRGFVKEDLDGKAKAEDFRAVDLKVDGLRVEDDSASDIDAKPRSTVGEFSIGGLNVEENSASDTFRESIRFPGSSFGGLDLEDRCAPLAPRASFLSLSTETLQAIFMELPMLSDVKAIARTCHRMRDVFKGYEHGILLNMLSRAMGPTLPGTIGALAIFASPQKGLFDEPLLWNLSISLRFWAEYLKKCEEKVKKLVTPKLAKEMLAVYQRFQTKFAHRQRGRKSNGPPFVRSFNGFRQSNGPPCSTCGSFTLSNEEWNPLNDRTNGNCMEHVLQANAVRYRLNCRMALGSTEPQGPLKDGRGNDNSWDTRPLVSHIMRGVESSPDDEPDLEDDIGWQNDPWYMEDHLYNDHNWYEDESELDDYSRYEGEYQENGFWLNEDKLFQEWKDYPGCVIQQGNHFQPKDKVPPEERLRREVEVYQEDEVYPEDLIRQENELLEEEEKEIRLWFESSEAIDLLSVN